MNPSEDVRTAFIKEKMFASGTWVTRLDRHVPNIEQRGVVTLMGAARIALHPRFPLSRRLPF